MRRAVSVVVVAAVAACARGGNAASAQASASAVIARNPGSSSDGAAVYLTNCSSCHGADGRGLPDMFPPLAHSAVVTGDPRVLIKIVEDGIQGRVVVDGVSYDGDMPQWKGQISDEQLAAVITYVRSAWKNRASGVTLAQVQSVR